MVLQVKNLSCSYKVNKSIFSKKEKFILKNINFDVKQGEIFSIIGPSGAGKSTIGKIVLGIRKKMSGEILFLGEELSKRKIHDIQMIFQDPYSSLNPEMKVKNILAEPLMASGITDEKIIDEKIDKIMNDVWLDLKYKNMYPDELSGGQRQRVGIGAAMISNPKLVICDEPVASLDLHIQNQILLLLKKFNKENGTTIVFISHDLGVVYNISDRVLLLRKGEIQEIQDTENFFRNPQSKYGKYFLNGIDKYLGGEN